MLATDVEREVRELIEANRTRALWSLPAGYFPADAAATRRVLERIAARGDRKTFARAHLLMRQLS